MLIFRWHQIHQNILALLPFKKLGTTRAGKEEICIRPFLDDFGVWSTFGGPPWRKRTADDAWTNAASWKNAVAGDDHDDRDDDRRDVDGSGGGDHDDGDKDGEDDHDDDDDDDENDDGDGDDDECRASGWRDPGILVILPQRGSSPYILHVQLMTSSLVTACAALYALLPA